MKKVLVITAVSFMLGLFTPGISNAEQMNKRPFSGIEFLSGFGWGSMRDKENYKLYPIVCDFDFNLKPLIKKSNITPRQVLQFQIEPFISPISQPNPNFEFGTSFFFKTGLLPEDWKFQPYLKAGIGAIYMTLHTHEQATQFNFIEQAGAGIHYYFRKNIAVTAEYRLRHLSNARIKEPNKGIDTTFLLAGLTYQF